MGKHADSLGTFDNFRAPWETEAGAETEIDKAKLKRFIFGVMSDKSKAQDARDGATADLEVANTRIEELAQDVAKASPEEANKKISQLERKLADLSAERDGLVKEKEYNALRAEVLGSTEARYAKYVTGETREELEASLKSVLEDFGVSDVESSDDEDSEDEELTLNTVPQKRLKSVSNRQSDDVEEIDFDKVADQILGRDII